MSDRKVQKIKHQPIEQKPKKKHSENQNLDKTKLDQQIQQELVPSYKVIKPANDHEIARFVHAISAEKISNDTVRFRTDGVDTYKLLKKDKPAIYNQE